MVDSGNPGRAAAFGTSCAELSQRYRASGCGVGHRLRRRRAASVLARHRPGVLRTVDGAVAIGADHWDVRCYRRTASRRRPPRCRLPGRRWSPTTTGYVTAEAITSTSPVSKPWCRRSIRRSDPRGRPPSGRSGPASCGAAGPATSRSTRSSRAGTATSGSACCRRGNGAACGRGWASPAQFEDPKFDTIAARYGASREINALIAELFATQTMDELVTAGQSRGVPIAAVLSPAETLTSEHFRSVGALTEATIAPGVDVTVPVGPFVVDGRHVGYRPAGTGGRCATKQHGPHHVRNSRRPRRREHPPAVRRPADSGSRRHRGGRRTRADCSATSAPRSSRSRARPIRTACVRPRRAR